MPHCAILVSVSKQVTTQLIDQTLLSTFAHCACATRLVRVCYGRATILSTCSGKMVKKKRGWPLAINRSCPTPCHLHLVESVPFVLFEVMARHSHPSIMYCCFPLDLTSTFTSIHGYSHDRQPLTPPPPTPHGSSPFRRQYSLSHQTFRSLNSRSNKFVSTSTSLLQCFNFHLIHYRYHLKNQSVTPIIIFVQ